MIEQTGIVVAVADGAALVEVARQGGCSACSSADACGTSVVARLFGNGSGNGAGTRVRVQDPLGLAPGEQVVIGIRDAVLLRASMVAYLLPLVALIAAASAAEQAGLGEPGSVLLGALGLAVGLLVTGLITGGTGARARFRPLLLRRVRPHGARAVPLPHPCVGG